MNRVLFSKKSEKGFVLATAMVILLALTFIGLIATKISVNEMMVSGNEKFHQQTFYQADGGTELAQYLVYHNSICSTTSSGFTGNYNGNTAALINGSILVEDLSFADTKHPIVTDIADGNREAVYYTSINVNDIAPHTNFLTTSTSQINPGSGLQMVSGYEGLGAGSVGGGTSRNYLIASQHHGLSNSQTTVQVQWRLDSFVVSNALSSDCKY